MQPQLKEIRCALVDDCPLLYTCASDEEANPADCPMTRWNSDAMFSTGVKRAEELQGK